MNILILLIPIALAMGFVGLLAFLWCLKSDQFSDLDGSAVRILQDDSVISEKAPEVQKARN